MSADVAKQIAELEAKQAIAAARRAKLREVDELASAKRALEEETALADAEELHGVDFVRSTKTPMGLVIVKGPHKATWRKFQAKFADGKLPADADQEAFVRPCLLRPEASAFDALIEKHPGILLEVVNAVASIARGQDEALAGK